MPIYLNHAGLLSKVEDFLDHGADGNILAFGDGSVRVGHNVRDIAEAIGKAYPQDVSHIVIGRSNRPGWKAIELSGNPGGTVILIGLRDIEQAHSLGALLNVLATGGNLHYWNDGELVPAV